MKNILDSINKLLSSEVNREIILKSKKVQKKQNKNEIKLQSNNQSKASFKPNEKPNKTEKHKERQSSLGNQSKTKPKSKREQSGSKSETVQSQPKSESKKLSIHKSEKYSNEQNKRLSEKLSNINAKENKTEGKTNAQNKESSTGKRSEMSKNYSHYKEKEGSKATEKKQFSKYGHYSPIEARSFERKSHGRSSFNIKINAPPEEALKRAIELLINELYNLRFEVEPYGYGKIYDKFLVDFEIYKKPISYIRSEEIGSEPIFVLDTSASMAPVSELISKIAKTAVMLEMAKIVIAPNGFPEAMVDAKNIQNLSHLLNYGPADNMKKPESLIFNEIRNHPLLFFSDRDCSNIINEYLKYDVFIFLFYFPNYGNWIPKELLNKKCIYVIKCKYSMKSIIEAVLKAYKFAIANKNRIKSCMKIV